MSSSVERLREAVKVLLEIGDEAWAERDALLSKAEADRLLIEEAAKVMGRLKSTIDDFASADTPISVEMGLAYAASSRVEDMLTARLNEGPKP